jgi:alkaline phosphatase D
MIGKNKAIILLFSCLTLLSFVTQAAATKTVKQIKKSDPYKKQHRDAFPQIMDGKELDDVIEHLNNLRTRYSGDLEALYTLAIVYAKKGDIEKSFSYMKKAVDGGLPFERFLVGPRDLLKPLTDSTQFQEFSKKYVVELLHGPMLGCVTHSGAKFWIRTVNEVPFQVIVSEKENMDSPIKSCTVKTSKEKDYTAVTAVKGLKPNIKYYYQLIVNGKKLPEKYTFKTFVKKRAGQKLQLGFGGGASYSPQHERMWNTIASQNLAAFLFLGDNVYIDHPEHRQVQQYSYYRRQSRPEYRNLTASTSIYAIWDDHDFGDNDSIGGPKIIEPWWKIPVWQTFRNNWNNLYYGGGDKQPGCWFDFSIGDVDFFMLDCRYYRTDPQKKNPQMLGPAQKKWLLKKLKQSKATFKVICSSVPMCFGTKPVPQRTRRGMVPGGLDTWEGFKAEREEIFSFIEKNKIEGVIILSADRHRSDARKIRRPNGYDLYEFESSNLTGTHTHKLVPGAIFGYNKKCSFGLLTFDTTLADPEVTFQIVNIDNEIINTLRLRKSQLTFRKTK